MSPGIVRVYLLLVIALPCAPQDGLSIVRDWQPSAVGDSWFYAREVRGGERAQPTIHRWEQEVATVGVTATPLGLLIRRQISYPKTAPPRWLQRRDISKGNILAHGNCLYIDLPGEQLDAGTLPDVCLPLREGATWGDPKKGRGLWTVAGRGKKNADDPASVSARAWRLEAHLASGDDNYVWFEKGVGVVAERTWHNGTYDDESASLIRFQPAGR